MPTILTPDPPYGCPLTTRVPRASAFPAFATPNLMEVLLTTPKTDATAGHSIPGFPALTAMTGGLHGLWGVGGATGAGKTTLALNVVASAASPNQPPTPTPGAWSSHSDPHLAALYGSEAYQRASHPDHARAVADVTARFHELYGDEGADPGESPKTLSDTRAFVGVEFSPEADLPSQELRDRWSSADEAVTLQFFVQEAIPAQTVQAMYSFYLDQEIVRGGVHTRAAEDAFRARFAPEIGTDGCERLILWHRSRA